MPVYVLDPVFVGKTAARKIYLKPLEILARKTNGEITKKKPNKIPESTESPVGKHSVAQ